MAQAIIAQLRRQQPDVQIVFTHFSPSAERVAQRVGADVADYVPGIRRAPCSMRSMHCRLLGRLPTSTRVQGRGIIRADQPLDTEGGVTDLPSTPREAVYASYRLGGSKQKLPAAAARKPGQPNPYVVGKDVAKRYLTIANECAQAAVAGVMASAQ
jgi:hypothetical protein